MTITEIDQQIEILQGEHRSANLIIKISHDPNRRQIAAHNAVAIEGEIAELERKRAELECESKMISKKGGPASVAAD